MSWNRRPARSWRRLALVSVFAGIPVYLVLLLLAMLFVAPFLVAVDGEWWETHLPTIPDVVVWFLAFGAIFGMPAALTGLVTARAARLHRWWRLVPAATACATVFVPWLVLSRSDGVPAGGLPVMWAGMSLGSLAGVVLVDYLTRGEGQQGDVGETHPTQEGTPVG